MAVLLVSTLLSSSACPLLDTDSEDQSTAAAVLAALAAGLAGATGAVTADTANVGGNVLIPLNITSSSTTTLHSGLQTTAGTADGAATAARYRKGLGVVYCKGAIYMADQTAHTIRKIDISTGQVSTVIGLADTAGNTDAAGTAARINGPLGITCDGTNLYWSESVATKVRKADLATFTVTSLANFAGIPAGLTVVNGQLYVAQNTGGVRGVIKVDASTGAASTFAGQSSTGDTLGVGTAAQFNFPGAICTNGSKLFLTDTNNLKIKAIDISTQEVTLLAAAGGNPIGCVTDGSQVYFFNTNQHYLRKVAVGGGTPVDLVGSSGNSGYVEGSGTTARFLFPWGVTSDGTKLWLADSDNHVLRTLQ